MVFPDAVFKIYILTKEEFFPKYWLQKICNLLKYVKKREMKKTFHSPFSRENVLSSFWPISQLQETSVCNYRCIEAGK
jgi:hypothetical protein